MTATRINFYTRTGRECWTFYFDTLDDATKVLDAIRAGQLVGIPLRWYGATLYHEMTRIDSTFNTHAN